MHRGKIGQPLKTAGKRFRGPERGRAGARLAGPHDHIVVGNLPDLPGLGPQGEHLAHVGFPDEHKQNLQEEVNQ